MITHAVVVPHPPLLVPRLGTGLDEEAGPLRAACRAATRRLTRSASRWLAVASGPTGEMSPAVGGSFAGYGVDVAVSLSESGRGEHLPIPLPVLIAGWLRAQAGAAEVRVRLLEPATVATDCAALGRALGELGEDVGLLVLGDGSNRHGRGAPGGEDDRAPGFDGGVAAALAAADHDALLALDEGLAAALGAGGRGPWQVLAGLVEDSGARWRAELLYSGAPFGVGYHVATWDRG